MENKVLFTTEDGVSITKGTPSYQTSKNIKPVKMMFKGFPRATEAKFFKSKKKAVSYYKQLNTIKNEVK